MMFAKRFEKVLWFLMLVAAISATSSPCLADSPGEQAKPEHAATAPPSCAAADNAWILVSSALVLMMTAPGLALFYCGLVRKKNVLSVMMQCIFMMCLMTVIWALYGYSLVFGGNQPWIGDFSYVLMHGVDAEWTSTGPHLPAERIALRDDAHDLPGHVFHHYPHPDLRGLCRADEIQHDGRVHGRLGHGHLLSAGPLALG